MDLKRLSGTLTVKNSLLLGCGLRNRLWECQIAFLPVGRGRILQDSDIPQAILPSSITPPKSVQLSEKDRQLVAQQLGKRGEAIVQAALDKQELRRAQNSN
ncbi:hypothetical protein C8R45DRAFT_1106289 [Mycena sanguinolenta]|nr:hypothetical protein C8R45DRAFT_1106289 [Mycena sanguinolenta]